MTEPTKNYNADDCSVAWGAAGLLLQFRSSSGVKACGLSMPAEASAALLRELRDVLGDHEARHGTAWSVHDRKLGAECDRRTGLGGDGEALGEHGAGMYRLLKNLPLNGFERSFKMQPGRLLTERFLLGIRRDLLGPEHIERIVDGLGLPQAFRAAFAAALSQTNFLHFGHEGGPEGSVRKLYQEFRQDEASAGPLLYTGYKWDPADASKHSVTQYRLQRDMGVDAMCARVAALLPGRAEIAAIASGLVRDAAARCEESGPLYVEVSEQGNPRLSCDINLYAAELALGQIEAALKQAAACFGIPHATLHALTGAMPEARLGHISTGTGRDGQPFMTVYYSLPDS